MKTEKRRICFMAALLMAVLFSVSVPAKQYTLSQAGKGTVYVPFDSSRVEDFQYTSTINCHKTGQIVKKSLTFDDQKLDVQINQSKEYKFCRLYIKAKKTGTSTVSFKYKHKGTTSKVTLTVKAFKLSSCPVKAVKFGKKKLSMTWMSMLFTDLYPEEGKKTCTGKVSVTLKKGWSLKEFRLGDTYGAGKKISMTDKVKLAKEQFLYVTVKSPNGNEVEFIIRCGVDW